MYIYCFIGLINILIKCNPKDEKLNQDFIKSVFIFHHSHIYQDIKAGIYLFVLFRTSFSGFFCYKAVNILIIIMKLCNLQMGYIHLLKDYKTTSCESEYVCCY